MSDHLGEQLSPIAALTAAAAATTRLRVGSYVFANDYRYPLVLAREAATLDLLSGGRFELASAPAGTSRTRPRSGYRYDPPPRRIDRLAEAVPLVTRLLAGETVDRRGRALPPHRARIGIAPAGARASRSSSGEAARACRAWRPEKPIVASSRSSIRAAGRCRARRRGGDSAQDRDPARGRRTALRGARTNVIVGDAGLVGSGRPLCASLLAATQGLGTGWIGPPYVL